jgi:hypothetical protein
VPQVSSAAADETWDYRLTPGKIARRSTIMISVTHSRQLIAAAVLTLALLCCAALPTLAQKKSNLEKPLAGPRATPLRITILYVAADPASQKMERVQIGREMVVAEKSGPWLRVYANTDTEELHTKDEPVFNSSDTPPPISGWVEAKGVVIENTPNGDQILMGEAANQESLASDPRGPANAARSARMLYRRIVEMFPNSPLVPEAAWRAADDEWQIEKADAATRSSAKERDPYMRDQMDEDELKKILRLYPKTRWSALAAYELIDNKLCGDWQGSPKCPEKESEYFEKYADEFPDGPRTAQALYQAVYRQAVLVDMFKSDGSDKKIDEAHNRANELLKRLRDKFPQSDYTWRAGTLGFKLDQGVPVYGIDLP